MKIDERKRTICRCEEITYGEIIDAIRNGRRSVKAIKRATRAGMGACQGRTCSHLIMQILVEECDLDYTELNSDRPGFPLIPVTITSLERIKPRKD